MDISQHIIITILSYVVEASPWLLGLAVAMPLLNHFLSIIKTLLEFWNRLSSWFGAKVLKFSLSEINGEGFGYPKKKMLI